ncbi:MAG: DUF2520 domain-containing protein [Proteobacteria bacterium]|nr:DUF2520 domain-containing protein [Pseudomonadota bacterium]
MITTRQYGIIGDGRLARHLLHWFALKELPTRQWHRRGAMAEQPPEMFLQGVDLVIVAISDDAIETFIEEHPGLKAFVLVHCSGSLSTPLAFGAHFLQTFGDQRFPDAVYDDIPVVLDDDAPAFEMLFPELSNPVARIALADKAKYHALSVLACSGTQLLWQKLQKEFREMDIDPALARPLLMQSADAVLADPSLTVTGPFTRGDTKTMSRNLTALAGDPYAPVYQAFQGLFGDAIKRQS